MTPQTATLLLSPWSDQTPEEEEEASVITERERKKVQLTLRVCVEEMRDDSSTH